MTRFSVRAYLEETHQITASGKGKVTCPFCGRQTLSLKGDTLAKCFHPGCQKFITAYSADGERNPIQTFLWEIATLCKQELLRQKEVPDAFGSSGWRYLTEERQIHPQVLEDALVGIVPGNVDIPAMSAPHRNRMAELATNKGCSKEQQKRFEELLDRFDEAVNKLEETWHPGNIAFFYTNPRREILSIRFREPFAKRFSWFKPFKLSGVFDPLLYDPELLAKSPGILLVEGEFNLLTLQSVLLRLDQHYQPCLALGGASSVDWRTLKQYKNRWVLFADHDDGGQALAEAMQEKRSFRLTQDILPDSDLDSFLRRQPTPAIALESLKRLIGEAVPKYRYLDAIAHEIHEIRKNKDKLKEFEVNQQVSRLIMVELKERGIFYQTPLAPYYFDLETNHLSLIGKESRGMVECLHRLHLNPVENIHGYVLKELMNECHLHGQPTQVYQLFNYHFKTNTLYWANSNEEILKITTDNIEVAVNGADGLLFLNNPKYQPFTRTEFDPQHDYLDELLLRQANFNEDGLLNTEEQRLILRYYFLALFFGSIQKTRPILCPVAGKGSGKTSLLRRMGQLLVGPDFDVSPLPEKLQDFQTAVANNYFLAFDNVDEKCRWLNDSLAVCATGGAIRLRTLYTTSEETELRINVFLALNSRTPNFRRDDVSERLLLLYLKPWGAQKRMESELNLELLRNRDAFLSWLLVELQSVLKALAAAPVETFRTTFRMADFAGFAYRVAAYQGQGEKVTRIFEKLTTVQAEFTLENDPLFDCLMRLAEKYPGERFNAAQLHQRLCSLAEAEKLTYTVRNAVSLGKLLNQLKPSLEAFLEVRIEKGHANKTFYAFTLREETP